MTTRPLFDLPANEPACGRLHELKLGDRGIAEPLDGAEPGNWRGDRLCERAEGRDQLFGKRLNVAPWQSAE